MGQGKLLIILAAVSLLSTCSSFVSCSATESGANAVLGAMEQKLFFKTYNSDTPDDRLSRIEKRVFGEAGSGDFAERLEKVRAVAAPQMNPDGTTTGAPPEEPQQPEQPKVSPQEAARVEKEAAAQRAKVAAMAAKEEECTKLLAEGVDLFRQKNNTQALDKFKQVLSIDPHNAEAHFNMGVAYESISKLAEASNSYMRAANERPDNPDYQEAVAAVQKKLKAGGGGEAKSELKLLAEDAAAAYKRGEYFSAIDLYKQLDAKAPNQHLVKYNLGTLYFATKNYSVALEYYQEALRLKPGEPRYQNAVQQLSGNLNQSRQAQQALDQQWDAHEAQVKAYNEKVAARGGTPIAVNQQMPPAGQPPQGYVPPPQGGYAPPQQGGYVPPPPQQQGNAKPPKKQKTPKAQTQPPQQQNFNPAAINNVVAPAQPVDMMSGIGINAKSSHDGLVITYIGIASRAHKVGLQQGDIIKAVDGTVVKSTGEMNDILGRKGPNSTVQLIIQRAKQIGTFTL